MPLSHDFIISKINNHKELEQEKILSAVHASWQKISPFWPLKNLTAFNPLSGFEGVPFKDALERGHSYFQQNSLPEPMQNVNRETIKWLQAFFDEGQAAIKMPLRYRGLLNAVKTLLSFDNKILSPSTKNHTLEWYHSLPDDAEGVIQECLRYLDISQADYDEYLTLMLTTLPGWAAYIKYKTTWATLNVFKVSGEEYLALRLLITCLMFADGKTLLTWHTNAEHDNNYESIVKDIEHAESYYRHHLLQKMCQTHKGSIQQAAQLDAQLVFCIDVRSEQFRRAIEAQGAYETYSLAGFFGIPLKIKNEITGESRSSCPVLLNPAHRILMAYKNNKGAHGAFKRTMLQKKLYQSFNDNFITSFVLAECLGLVSGIVMVIRTFFPNLLPFLKTIFKSSLKELPTEDSIQAIPLKEQLKYATNALRVMGLVNNFAPLIVFCGHGSQTENNAYASALDCGACGGGHGGPNAFVLATILNKGEVRSLLKAQGIIIPDSTYFLAAQHTTTTDHVELFDHHVPEKWKAGVIELQKDLVKAQHISRYNRLLKLGEIKKRALSSDARATDWAQTRPEWGLAGNASFIVAPRSVSKHINLEGRAFLQSYDWKVDHDGSLLTTVLTASMIVAQGINCQHLFSTLDNVAFGGGSKITQNIVGKIGVMQGNASDLMHGLPLQSVFKSDGYAYHEALRLLTVVYAPRHLIDQVISKHQVLQRLFTHEWVHLTCIDPISNCSYKLTRDLQWEG